PNHPMKKRNPASTLPRSFWYIKHCRTCSNQAAFSFWRNSRTKIFQRQSFGVLSAEKHTALRKSFFYPQSAIRNPQSSCDSTDLQFALASRSPVFPPRVSRENVPAR